MKTYTMKQIVIFLNYTQLAHDERIKFVETLSEDEAKELFQFVLDYMIHITVSQFVNPQVNEVSEIEETDSLADLFKDEIIDETDNYPEANEIINKIKNMK